MPHCGKSPLLTNLLCSDAGFGQRMQFAQLERREFIAVIGVLMHLAADDKGRHE